MKRICLCLFLAAATVGLVFAQGEKRRAPGAVPEKTVISGILGIAKGSIALKSGNDTYYVMGLNRFVGFIDGLKEGAQVNLEGYAFTSPQNDEGKVFKVTKLTLNGKDYDLDSAGNFAGSPGGFGTRRNFNPSQGWKHGSENTPWQNKPGNRRPNHRGR
jgi:hypothetical protein